jgi:hypothetical protein
MNKILVVGCGGIGSYLVREIQSLINIGQINLFNTSFTIADDDIVELEQVELQNFTNEDVGDNKAVALTKRYPSFKALQKRINSEKQLKDYDLIVLCVDNDKTRELVVRSCWSIHQSEMAELDKMLKSPSIPSFVPIFEKRKFIDLRTSGRKVFAMPMGKSFEDDLKFIDRTDFKTYSCQDKEDLEKGLIQVGNRISAMIGTQMLLNWLRGKENRTISLLI